MRPKRPYFRQAEPPSYENCVVFVVILLFLLGVLIWLLLKIAGVLN